MANIGSRLRRNIHLLYAIDFFTNSYFTLPVNLLFGKEYLHLSYFASGSLVFMGYATSLVFDFLGGAVADWMGRKQANLLGILVQIGSFVPFLITKSYPLLLLSSAFYGIGLALSSNSMDSLIYEEARSSGKEQEYQTVAGTTTGFLYAGRFYASILGGLTFKINPRLPYLLTIIALVCALIACAGIQIEKSIDKTKVTRYRKIISDALNEYRCDPHLLRFVVFCGLFSFWGNMLFVYYQPYFTNLHVTPSALGVLFACISLGSASGSLIMRKLPNRLSARKIQSLQLVGLLTTAILLLVLHMPIVLTAPLVLSVFSGFLLPNMRVFVHKITVDKVRSSVLSVATSFISAGLVFGLATSYYMADHLTKNTILGVIMVGSVITLLANHFILKDSRHKVSQI
jgi:MFS family permease